MSYGSVYLVKNLVNGKSYVGQTRSPLRRRWNQHVGASKGPGKKTQVLHYAVRKYGASAFEVAELCECSSRWHLNVMEVLYIQVLNTMLPRGYNAKVGGSESSVTPETRRKMSASSRRRKWTAADRERMLAILKGSKLTDEHRANISAARRGKKTGKMKKPRVYTAAAYANITKARSRNITEYNKSEIARSRTAERNRLSKMSEAHKERLRVRNQKSCTLRSPAGVLVTEESQVLFCKKHGLKPRSLSRLLVGEYKSSKGWTLP